MSGIILRLDADDLCALVAEFNPVDVVTEGLLAPGGRLADAARGRGPHPCPVELRGDVAVVQDAESGARCALPVSGLRACRAAALTALAAGHLLAPGVVTVSLIGSGRTARIHLLTVARSLPDVSHVAVHPPQPADGPPVDRRVAAVLERAGIGLALAGRVEEATFGASLVVLAGPDRPGGRLGRLAPGAVLVNATGHRPPPSLTGVADALFVDDLGQREQPGTAGPAGTARLGVAADLRQVFTGEHAGRSRTRQILLVDLRTTAVLDGALAGRLHQTALRHDRGRLVPG